MRKEIIEVLFDVVAGTVSTYTPDEHQEALGGTDKLAIQTIIDKVTGTSPTVTMELQHSCDRRNWSVANTFRTTAALLTTGANIYVDTAGGGVAPPQLGFRRIRIQLGGTNPQARVKMLVCLRDAA